MGNTSPPSYYPTLQQLRDFMELHIPNFPTASCATSAALVSLVLQRSGELVNIRSGTLEHYEAPHTVTYDMRRDVIIDLTRDAFPGETRKIIIEPGVESIVFDTQLTAETTKSLGRQKVQIEQLLARYSNPWRNAHLD